MNKIDVVLLQDYKTLGKKYDQVAVKPSYAKNVLFPEGIARFADTGTLNDLRAKMESHRKSQQTLVEKLKAMLQVLEENGITLTAEANEQQKLYGHIHAKDIAAKLTAEHGVDVSSDYLHMKDIDALGTYAINFNGEGVQGIFQVHVTAK